MSQRAMIDWCIFVSREYVKSAGKTELDLWRRGRVVWIPMAVLEARSQVFFFKQHSVSSARRETRTHMSAGSHPYLIFSPMSNNKLSRNPW